jgi:hypothetical protein
MMHLYEVQMHGATGQIGKSFLMNGLPFEGLRLKDDYSAYKVTKVMMHLPQGEALTASKVDVRVEYISERYV